MDDSCFSGTVQTASRCHGSSNRRILLLAAFGMAGSSGAGDPVGHLLVQVQNDLEHLKKKLGNSKQQNGAMVDIQALETAIQRTELGIKKHTQDYLAYISCSPMTILHDQSKDKYTPRVLKWGPQLEAAKQNQKLPLTDISGTRRQPLSTIGHTSPGQQHKLAFSTRIICNTEKPTHRDLLNQNYGINLPLISCKPKASVPMEKIVKGPTFTPLSVLPASHRMDASLTPPPVHEKDVQKGILSLLQRGLIPPAARLTLVPSAIQPQTLSLHSAQTRWTSSHSQGRDHVKLTEKDPHQTSQDQDQTESLLSSDGMETPFPSVRHNVSNKTTRTSANVTNQEREASESPASQDPWELTAISVPIGQSFTIYNGVIDPNATDFLAFKQHYCLSWGSFMTFLESLVRLLQDYAVPNAVVNGERMKIASLDVELGRTPSISHLLSVLENRSWVHKFLNQPGQRYKGREGRSAAALKIQSTWRGYKDRVAYLAYHQQRWATGVIAIAWLLCVQKSRVHKMLLEARDHHLQNFRSRAKHLASNWNHIRTCRRSIIHIPSLGYTEEQRAQATDLHIEQNLQMGRLCDIADPNVDVIYICPVKLDEEMAQYYRKLLGLRAAVLSENPQDATELQERFTIITPEAVDRFPNHHMCLSSLLKYSPKALQRIRNLIRGREAYIVGRVPHVDDLAVADMLGVPILGTEPEVAHLYSTKSGSKRIFASAYIPIPPGQYDIYTEEQFRSALGQLITDNLLVTRWLFKVDNEFGSNGTAFCDIGVHLPCYSWALRESKKYGPDTWKQKWAQEKVLQQITEELPQVLEHYAQPVNRRRYPTWGRFLQALVSHGGVIEAYPPAESITCLTVDLLINPGGEIQMVSCGDQIHGGSPLECIGSSVPQCSVPPSVLASICNHIGEACKIRGVLGYLSVELITFIDPQSLKQQIWATDLDLCYSDQLAMTQLMLYLTNGTLDCTNSQLNVPSAYKKMDRPRHRDQTVETPRVCSRVAVLSTRLFHTNLSLVYYNVFFQMCKAHGIGYDVKEKQGTVFVLLENLKRHRIEMLSIAEDLQGALMTFARNLFIIHQEISAPKMQGETNFKDCVQEIETILGVTEENKLVFEQKNEDIPP
ncbi:PREDICTED: IQ domain-containing protein H [Nanorana parkeri]|uniref:IQ domain-containing protein H n=1 Tax=Nanorana parkeri TaxID=125878 RepID=UPI0008545939|nr:PREDICTED: IQ domain-containing protein H [Nanorana parkeri]